MKAKEFYMAAQKNQHLECLEEVALEMGEVIEIDSGLLSYCFQYLGANAFAQVAIFEQFLQNKQQDEDKDGAGERAR